MTHDARFSAILCAAIGDMSPDALAAAIATAKGTDNAQAAGALGQIADKRRKLADIQAQLAQIDDTLVRIGKDQERLRADLASVPKDGDLAKRYLDMLSAQENQIADLGKSRDIAAKAQTAPKAELADAVATVNF